MGIYQLIFPVLMLGMAVSSFAIQSAISKYTAEYVAIDGTPYRGRCFLSAGILFSLLLSLAFSFALYYFSDPIATVIIGETKCGPLLQLLAWTIPFSSLHSCFNGYFYGLKKAAIPALSQIIEQFFRVIGVYLFVRLLLANGEAITPIVAVYGILFGEIAAVFFTIHAYGISNLKKPSLLSFVQLLRFCVPLSINRVLLSFFQSAESILIPGRLQAFGMSAKESLSLFGVINGMALPVIMFPSVFTNSLSVMLLPSISEAAATHNDKRIHYLLVRTSCLCTLTGLFFSLIFCFSGNWFGTVIYGNSVSGEYITALGWLCPVLFLSIALNSILNGLGKTRVTLFLNVFGSCIRLCGIVFGIPVYGIHSYLISLLLSYFSVCILSILFFIVKNKKKSVMVN